MKRLIGEDMNETKDPLLSHFNAPNNPKSPRSPRLKNPKMRQKFD
jgi:hypothetical protein